MANRRIYVDKSELVLLIPTKKKVESVNVSSSRITRIQFDKCKELFLLFPRDSEKISIVTPARSEPVVYTKGKNKAFFDQYKAELREFSKNNNVTFIDNLGG